MVQALLSADGERFWKKREPSQPPEVFSITRGSTNKLKVALGELEVAMGKTAMATPRYEAMRALRCELRAALSGKW